MKNTIDKTGITTDSLAEIVTGLNEDYREIYGTDIIVESNTPDGQKINIEAQLIKDMLDLIVATFNSFDPDQATGKALDQRVAINNIQRRGGTYTQQQVQVTATKSLNLVGLDGVEPVDITDANIFTVADNAGNKFYLNDSVSLTSGVTTLTFLADTIGAITTTPNTITNIVTVTQGISSVNNSSAALEVGIDEETDAALRIKRQQSTANGATGYLKSLLGVILNLDNVTEAKLFENTTNATDADGIPAKSIWVIVEGGSAQDIANAIYAQRSLGCGMKGTQTYEITEESGVILTIKYDRPTAQNLHLRFDIKPTITGQTFDETAIKNYIVANKTYQINEAAETSDLTAKSLAAINDSSGGGVALNVEISDDGVTWYDYLETAAKNDKWVLDSSRITITVL